MPDIRDITDPGEFLPQPSMPLWIWLLLTIAIITAIAFFLFHCRKQSAVKQKKTLLEKAIKSLTILKEKAPNLSPETIATRISIIIRRYLEAAFEDPALFETNEEFTLRPYTLEHLHPESRKLVTNHLTELSQLKYSPRANTSDTTALIDEAKQILAHIELNVTPKDATPHGK